jgi:integrase
MTVIGRKADRSDARRERHLPARKKGPKRHHPAMPFTEVPAFFGRLKNLSALSARALELTILTAARTSEVLLAKWSEVDLEAGIWICASEA